MQHGACPPDTLTHLCSGAQKPLPAKPNTHASFPAACCHAGFPPLRPLTPLPRGQSEALLAKSPHYCLETETVETNASSIILSPLQRVGWGARHEVKESSSSRGALLFRDRPLQMLFGWPCIRNPCSGTGLDSGDPRMNKTGHKDLLRNSQSKMGGRDLNKAIGCPRGGQRHSGGPQDCCHRGIRAGL